VPDRRENEDSRGNRSANAAGHDVTERNSTTIAASFSFGDVLTAWSRLVASRRKRSSQRIAPFYHLYIVPEELAYGTRFLFLREIVTGLRAA
jgi:hypothetical protein